MLCLPVQIFGLTISFAVMVIAAGAVVVVVIIVVVVVVVVVVRRRRSRLSRFDMMLFCINVY